MKDRNREKIVKDIDGLIERGEAELAQLRQARSTLAAGTKYASRPRSASPDLMGSAAVKTQRRRRTTAAKRSSGRPRKTTNARQSRS